MHKSVEKINVNFHTTRFYRSRVLILISDKQSFFTRFCITLKINSLHKNVFKVPEVPKKVPEKAVPVPVHKKPEPPPAKGISSYS